MLKTLFLFLKGQTLACPGYTKVKFLFKDVALIALGVLTKQEKCVLKYFMKNIYIIKSAYSGLDLILSSHAILCNSLS